MRSEDSKAVASAFCEMYRAVEGLRSARCASAGPMGTRLEGDFARMVMTADRIEAKAASAGIAGDAVLAARAYSSARSAPRVLSFFPASAFAAFEKRVEAFASSARSHAVRRASAFMDGSEAVVDGPRGIDLLGSFVRFAAVAGVAATLNVSVAGKADAGIFSFMPSVGSTDVTDLKPGPSGAMQDLATDVLSANLGGAEDALGVLETADMVARRCALGDAPRGETACVVKRSGIVFDYNAGRYEAWLLAVEGFSDEPRLVAVEEDGELSVVDKDAYSLVRQGALNEASDLEDAPEM